MFPPLTASQVNHIGQSHPFLLPTSQYKGSEGRVLGTPRVQLHLSPLFTAEARWNCRSTVTSLKKKELDFPCSNSSWPSCPVGMEQITDPISCCVLTTNHCCLPSRQILTLLCPSEPCYKLHDFSADDRPRFLLPALPFLCVQSLLDRSRRQHPSEPPNSPYLARVFLFHFWEEGPDIHTVSALLCAGNSMLACYLRLMGRHRSFVLFFAPSCQLLEI